MSLVLQCATKYLGLVAVGCTLLALIWKYSKYQPIVYKYTIVSALPAAIKSATPYAKYILTILRVVIILLLTVLSWHPQLVDSKSKIKVEGLDIVLALDVSGSMQFQDGDEQHHSRLDVAKQEAIRFIDQRTDDAIGLVIFAKDAVSRCPITIDKKMLRQFVQELQIGVIDADGTLLVTGIITAINRLKNAPAASKVMIVLTDGEPSEGDLDPKVAINIAKELNIKIYTVGFGSDQEQFFLHPMYGMVQQPKVNSQLLQTIAQQTGGQFFMAHNAQDMRRIYDTINTLETRKHEIPFFTRYIELIIPLGLSALLLLFCELFLSTFVWFGL